MSLLTIHPQDRPDQADSFRDPETIADRLWQIGVLFERWTADCELPAAADQDAVIAAYRSSIDRLIDRYEFSSVDVISVASDHPQKSELRAKFLDEHTHDDFEVRFFVEGRGLFFLHPDENVYAILCEQGDLISVPSHTPHWFDMGEMPHIRAIRLFTTPDGWVANFTGSKLAMQFPALERYVTRFA